MNKKLLSVVATLSTSILFSCENNFAFLKNKTLNIERIYESKHDSKLNETKWNIYKFNKNQSIKITDKFFEVCYPRKNIAFP